MIDNQPYASIQLKFNCYFVVNVIATRLHNEDMLNMNNKHTVNGNSQMQHTHPPKKLAF